MRGRIILGILLLVVGLSWALSFSGVSVFPGGWSAWWPSLLVLVGLVKIAIPPRQLVWGPVLIGVGALLQAWRLELVPGVSWAYAAPIAIILAGLLVLTSGWRRRRWRARHGWGPHGCYHDAGWRESREA